VRLAALGDSITVGYGDPLADGQWRGWAALLAEALDARLYNLAGSGALTADVARDQLPGALAVRPHLAAVIVGTNDTLRGTFDAGEIGCALARVVGELRDAGAVVLTVRLPDPGRMFGLPGSLARPLARRVRAINAAVDAIALRHRTVHFDVAGDPATYEPRMWSVDRLHPSERGHRMLARGFADRLAAAGWRVPHPVAVEPTSPPPSLSSRAWWMATRGSKWVWDRSTDLVPHLVAMAAAEWWSGVRWSGVRGAVPVAAPEDDAPATGVVVPGT
jgi:lysophospholipase L1-like esterase